ncbi:hypothetical protein GUJ93_ZPchr0010g9548 [Zizania palustris]|uniref:Uncharacterized protein n=1 Tax=Zizania palustris TaxID=103762 RepID=A0A8J5W9G5_ZIZPA|nr:hypothetical protein GUJ93_ZPchr0010g9548 [Zizania palustris]
MSRITSRRERTSPRNENLGNSANSTCGVEPAERGPERGGGDPLLGPERCSATACRRSACTVAPPALPPSLSPAASAAVGVHPPIRAWLGPEGF